MYVDDPYDVEEWIVRMKDVESEAEQEWGRDGLDFAIYAPERISRQYLALLKEPVWKRK